MNQEKKRSTSRFKLADPVMSGIFSYSGKGKQTDMEASLV
jgi:hypothetical protein